MREMTLPSRHIIRNLKPIKILSCVSFLMLETKSAYVSTKLAGQNVVQVLTALTQYKMIVG